MVNKKRKKKEISNKNFALIVVGIIILIVLAGIIFSQSTASENSSNYVSSSNYDNTDITKATIGKTCREIQSPYEEQEEYIKTEYYIETVPYTEEECSNVELRFSMTDSKWDYSTCNDYDTICYEGHYNFWNNWVCDDEETFCTSKTLSYSANINNLDEEKGSWKVEVTFYLDGSIYQKVPLSKSLYSQTTETFTGRINVDGNSPSGDANQAFSATAKVIYIPTKRVCKTVTKYKEVQREKQVTAYRPVTKYKTEKVCD